MGIQLCRLFIHSSDLTGVRLGDMAVRIEDHREKAGFVGGLRGQPLCAQEIPFARPSAHGNLAIRRVLRSVVKFGEFPVVAPQQGQNRIGVGDYLLIAHQVDTAQDYGKDDGQGDHAGGNKLAAQLFDHVCSSSE